MFDPLIHLLLLINSFFKIIKSNILSYPIINSLKVISIFDIIILSDALNHVKYKISKM